MIRRIEHENKLNRRQIIGEGLGILGIAGLALSSNSAYAIKNKIAVNYFPSPLNGKNPKNIHPSPPFQRQTQAVPGLANKMSPKPNHGETSYKGNGHLLGRKALITGGDSGIGRALPLPMLEKVLM